MGNQETQKILIDSAVVAARRVEVRVLLLMGFELLLTCYHKPFLLRLKLACMAKFSVLFTLVICRAEKLEFQINRIK